MHKKELIETIAASQSLEKAKAERIVNCVFDTIMATVGENEPVTITGFGKFECHKRAARLGRNPQTGAELKIKAHKTPVFHPGKKFKGYVE